MLNILEIQNYKNCPRCKLSLEISKFSKCKTHKDGLSWMCRQCNKEEKFKRKDKDKLYHSNRYNSLSDREIVLKNIRSNASKRGETTDITLEDIPTIPLFCPILGIEISVRHSNRSNAVSVDRIDNTKGYIKGNIVLISHKANVCKNNMSFEQIERLYSFYRQFQPE